MILTLLEVVVLMTLLLALLAPLESLRWWSHREPRPELNTPEHHPRPGVRRFAVYLSGIGVIEGDQNSKGEQALLDEIRNRLPDVVITDDVFPYAMENRGLPQRSTAWLWRHLDWARRRFPWSPLPLLINLRNMMQVLVSADSRYGTTYNYGMAGVIWDSLLAAGYDPAAPRPITLIGYSGGAQIACGAARFLADRGALVDVISIGGVYADDPGLDHIAHLTHLSGDRDHIQRLGVLAFPGRWPTAPLSAYARAVKENRIHTVPLPGVRHEGRGWYFSQRDRLPDGRTHCRAVADEIVAALAG